MGGAGGGSSKDFGGSGVNGGSPTSFDIPATELEAARPQVSIALIHFIMAWHSLVVFAYNTILITNFLH